MTMKRGALPFKVNSQFVKFHSVEEFTFPVKLSYISIFRVKDAFTNGT